MQIVPPSLRNRALAALVIAAASCAFLVGFKGAEGDYFFRINKSIDIFGRVYKEIALNYVDEVNPEAVMEAGIDGLLGTLDPYTNFISEKEADEVELLTAGKYGGIGISVGIRDGYIVILSLMEGYSAQRQGLLPGDRIIEIDGQVLVPTKLGSIHAMTRGEAGSEVRLKIERDGEPKPLEFTLIREEIQLKNLGYADFVGDGIAYFHIERFSRGAGDELRLAIRELRLKGAIKGVVLDLRDNPGGLLDVAVDVVEKFVPKGSLVVSTRGRRPESERKYYATDEPMLPDVPLVILVNRSSASASEIVAGAIQDLDRGLIVGTRSFGKGLVQTIAPLVYNTQMKITTAKYYTPSGRCIQEINYQRKGKDGTFETTPDSAKHKFKTLNGRMELEAGGITPDSSVGQPEHSNLYNELLRRSMFFKYASRHAASHSILDPGFDSLLIGFEQFLAEQKFSYQDEGDVKLKELAAAAEKLKYPPAIREEIDRLKEAMSAPKTIRLAQIGTEVLPALRQEVMARWKGERGRIEVALQDDSEVKAAVGMLQNAKLYRRKLGLK
jgi:carboxyl-terminal processing protease